MKYAALACAAAFAIALAACTRPPDAAALVASAKQHLAKRNYPSSIVQLKNALEREPKHGEARFLLGLSLLETGDAKGAEIELRKAVELRFDSDELTVAIARMLLAKDDLIGVVSEFGLKKLSDPKAHAELRSVVGDAEHRRNRPQEAQRAYQEALALDAGNVSANLGLARIAAANGELAEALKRCELAIASSPKRLEPRLLKGDLLAAQGESEGAAQAYRGAIEVAPRDINARLGLISHLMRQRSLEQAQVEVEALVRLAPADPRASFAQGKLLVEQGKFAHALPVLLEVLKSAPEHVQSLLLAGKAALQTGAYAEAEGHLRKAAFYAPESVEAKRLLAVAHLRMGQSVAAMAIVAELLGKGQKAPSVLALAGEAHLANGDVAAAVKYYEQAKSTVPENASVQTRLALLRVASGDARRGYAELEAAAANSGDDYHPDLALAATHLRRRQPERALAALESLEKKQPANPVTHNLRGLAFVIQRDYANARASFERALALSPTYVPAVNNLARLDMRERRSDAARKRFEAVLAKDPRNEPALLSLAALLRLHSAEPAEIEKLYRQAVARNPASPSARVALVNHYLGAREFKAAVDAAHDATVALPKSPPMMELLGIAQMSAGEHRLAVQSFRRYADMLPKTPQPLMMLATAQMAARLPDDAVRSLRSALALQPELAAAHRDLAAIYVAIGKSGEALKEARTLQTQRPKLALGFALEGEIHAAQRNWDAAEKVYREATRRFDLAVLVTRTHQVMLASGKGAEADALAESWVKSHPKDVLVLGYLAEGDLAARRYESAARRYASALQRAPDTVRFLNNLAWVKHQLQQPEGLALAERAHELAPDDPQVMDTLGVILLARKDLERGLELLGRASSLAPQAHGIRLNFAKALLAANRKDAARKELAMLAKLDQRNAVQQEAARLLSTL